MAPTAALPWGRSSRALTVGEQANGTCGGSMLWGSNPDARDGAPPFEGGASTCSAKHRGSPCPLVKGADCAGDVRFQDVVIDRSFT